MDHDNPVPCFSIRWSCMASTLRLQAALPRVSSRSLCRSKGCCHPSAARCIECQSLWLQQEHALFCSFNSLATIPLRLGCCRSCNSRSDSTSANGSNGGDSEELFHRSEFHWESLPDLFTITPAPSSEPPPKEWSCKASYPPFG